MNKKLIIANWKMAPSSLAEAQEILDFVNDYVEPLGENINFELVFCPPFVFMEEVGKMVNISNLSNISSLGAQDIFWDDAGADTGEVSGPMLSKLGVTYALIGHSERRWKLGESNETTNKKLKAALRNGITPVVCLGEKNREEDYKEFLIEQTKNTLNGLKQEEIERCIFAYEPVWAISSNPGAKPDTPQSALESIRIIKNTLIENWKLEIENLPKVLYGGSVTSANIMSFIEQKEFSGVLVGGASIDKEEFVRILSLIRD